MVSVFFKQTIKRTLLTGKESEGSNRGIESERVPGSVILKRQTIIFRF